MLFAKLVVILSFILGHVFGYRIFVQYSDKNLISKAKLTKFGTVFWAVVVLTALIATFYPITGTILLFSVVISVHFTGILLAAKRKREFLDELLPFISLLIMNMKCGNSFQTALKRALVDTGEASFARKMRHIYESVVFSQQNSRLSADITVQEVQKQLLMCEKFPHQAVKSLENWRDSVRIRSEFRRRSGQITAQIRAQSLLLTGLYIALLGYVMTYYSVSKNLFLISLSATLFLSGLAALHSLGRRIRWKI